MSSAGTVRSRVRQSETGGFVAGGFYRHEIALGLQWMGAYEPAEALCVDFTGEYRGPSLDGIDIDAFRLCPEHLSPLDDSLRCPRGHACKSWLVKSGSRIQFDGDEFRAELSRTA